MNITVIYLGTLGIIEIKDPIFFFCRCRYELCAEGILWRKVFAMLDGKHKMMENLNATQERKELLGTTIGILCLFPLNFPEWIMWI